MGFKINTSQDVALSLWGPAQDLHDERESRVLWCRIGWDGNQKCPSRFFIICVNLEHVYIYLSIYKKKFNNVLLGFKI